MTIKTLTEAIQALEREAQVTIINKDIDTYCPADKEVLVSVIAFLRSMKRKEEDK